MNMEFLIEASKSGLINGPYRDYRAFDSQGEVVFHFRPFVPAVSEAPDGQVAEPGMVLAKGAEISVKISDSNGQPVLKAKCSDTRSVDYCEITDNDDNLIGSVLRLETPKARHIVWIRGEPSTIEASRKALNSLEYEFARESEILAVLKLVPERLAVNLRITESSDAQAKRILLTTAWLLLFTGLGEGNEDYGQK